MFFLYITLFFIFTIPLYSYTDDSINTVRKSSEVSTEPGMVDNQTTLVGLDQECFITEADDEDIIDRAYHKIWDEYSANPLNYYVTKVVQISDPITAISVEQLSEYIALVIQECESFNGCAHIESIWHSTQFQESGTLIIYLLRDQVTQEMKPFISWVPANESEELSHALQEFIDSMNHQFVFHSNHKRILENQRFSI